MTPVVLSRRAVDPESDGDTCRRHIPVRRGGGYSANRVKHSNLRIGAALTDLFQDFHNSFRFLFLSWGR